MVFVDLRVIVANQLREWVISDQSVQRKSDCGESERTYPTFQSSSDIGENCFEWNMRNSPLDKSYLV